jgi:glycosyltransferase involved in cell wall biosynthesis
MPAVLVEAGLSAIPVVTTEVGFVRDVVVHGATGFVVPTRNPADLAHALRTALAERTRLGPVARRRCVQGFALDAATRRWDALLARLARA